jgi:hypothetical protein
LSESGIGQMGETVLLHIRPGRVADMLLTADLSPAEREDWQGA